MKKLFYLLLPILLFISCKKNDIHSVKYEIKFLNTISTGTSNLIDVGITPVDLNNKPKIDRFNLPSVWTYEYMGLKKGDKVYFKVNAQLSYRYEMRVYVDNKEVSYRKVIVSDYNYYDDHVEESSGTNDLVNEDCGVISFTY